ncbi:MAG TPA: RNA 2',3'-cyclic phosphodiesterase [Pyrinomonadaceae bacterium]|jgi:2'-5' RNA ligase
MTSPSTPTRLRLFCAVELSAEARARAADHIERLRQSAPHLKVSWERTEKLHLTLKFLGAVEPERVPALHEAAARAAAAVAPFELTLRGTSGFPLGRSPRVLWLGVVDESGRLKLLERRLEEECAAAGFAREERPFHAHVTLARIRTVNAAARRLARYHETTGFAPVASPVRELTVMRSDLTADGSRYTPLARHPLGGSEQQTASSE